jgi:tetratricopeptide (TPR) repeat protein
MIVCDLPLMSHTHLLTHSHAKAAVAMTNVADVHRDCGRLDAALELYERALALERKLHGTDALPVADTLNLIGVTLLALKRAEEALDKFDLALAIYDLATHGQHPQFGVIYGNKLRCEQALGEQRARQRDEKAARRRAE